MDEYLKQIEDKNDPIKKKLEAMRANKHISGNSSILGELKMIEQIIAENIGKHKKQIDQI